MKTRLTVLALLGGLLLVHAGGYAQDKTTLKPHRTLYIVRNGDAVALAEVLNKHFKGQAEVLAAPVGSGNALLISGSVAIVTEDVVKLLGELDRKPKMIEVEVILAEIPAKKAEGKDAVEIDFSGPDVLTKLDARSKAGQLGSMQRIKLTAVEGQSVAATTGGNKPVTSGRAAAGGAFGGGGPVQRGVSYQAVGTTVRMTARIGAGDVVAVELDLKDSQVKPPEAGDEVGAPSFENSNLTTKLSVPPGKAVVAQATRTEAKAGRTATFVIVTARIADPVAASNKQ